MFTQTEKSGDVINLLIFGEYHKNSRSAAELYAQRYPNRQNPVHQYFPYLENRFRQDGNRNAEETFIINEDTEINVIAVVEVDKTVSLRKIAQELQINDRGDPNFINFILFSDESRFTNNGMFNKQNTRYWAQQTQHEMREGNFQKRFGVNVWAGVAGNRIIGPI
ncbi:hypothetical protein NQ315_003247, partial [Exocentrus adspersus]